MNLPNWFKKGFPIFFILLFFFIFCEKNGLINQPKNNDYVLVEIKRHAHGTALSDTCGGIHIDFGGYTFDQEKGILRIYQYLDSSLYNNDTFRIICALERSIGGDLGEGKSGGVIAIDMFPDTLQIMTWPLSGNDSLIVSEFNSDGSIVFTFRHQNVTLIPKSKWDWSTVEEGTIIVGSFRIYDELTIINCGFLNKDNIKP